jgi:major membrane immunogen (membrane-anchored lipoprotein)
MRWGAALNTSSLSTKSRIAAVLIATATLTGCATTQNSGPPIASLASIGPPPAGKARIVVMRTEKGLTGWGDRALPVKVDGEQLDGLLTGTYTSVDRPPGRHQITAELQDHAGVSRYDFNAASGRIYYFSAKYKQKVNDIYAATVLGGLAGYALATAATNDGTGPVDLVPMSEAEAKQAIAAVR